VTDVKLLQGDLAWREGRSDYAAVAMKFALKGQYGRASERQLKMASGATLLYLWTFVRAEAAIGCFQLSSKLDSWHIPISSRARIVSGSAALC
jgi:hypothetical protein